MGNLFQMLCGIGGTRLSGLRIGGGESWGFIFNLEKE